MRANLSFLPVDTRNVAYYAAQKFFEITGVRNDGIFIEINKRIPVAAGLAGGSADAAAVLRGLNAAYGTGLSPDRLREIAAGIGSDVAFCISGGTALATGKGEIIAQLEPAYNFKVVLCNPPFSMPTPRVYEKLDCRKIKMRPDTDGALKAIKSGSGAGLASCVYNVLEAGVAQSKKCISEIREQMINYGAWGASMSGSGPTVFGLFDKREDAETAAKQLREQYQNTFLTEFKQMYL